MQFLKYIFFVFILPTASWAQVGFKNGNQLLAVTLEGRASIVCRERRFRPPPLPDIPRPYSLDYDTDSAIFNCRTEVLEPSSYDRFQGPAINEGAFVELIVAHADGSSLRRLLNYKGPQGVSAELIELSVSPVLKKPFLERGINKIKFNILDKNKNILIQGDFEVSVDRGPRRTCEQSLYNSDRLIDCRSQYSVCQRYFGQQFNNCR